MIEHTAPPSPLRTPLTDLKGIGPAKASRIQDALHVTFAEELVGLNADDIFHKLTENGPQIPRREIQQWLIQALRLVKAHAATASSEADANPAFPAASEQFAPSPIIQAEDSNRPVGTFDICRVGDQLRVKQVGEGPPPAELTTADPGTLYQWIQAQLTPERPELEAAPTDVPPQWRIEITKVEIVPLDPPGGPQPLQSQAYLARGTPFVIGVNFQITGAADDLHLASMPTVAQFSVRNRLTGENISLGTAQGQIHSQEATRLQSSPATLADPGIYQLQAVITLQGQEAVTGYRELQLVKVL